MLGLGSSSKQDTKAPPGLVSAAVNAVEYLVMFNTGTSPHNDNPNEQHALIEEISRLFSSMKLLLYGEPDSPPDKQVALELAKEVSFMHPQLGSSFLVAQPETIWQSLPTHSATGVEDRTHTRSATIVAHPRLRMPERHLTSVLQPAAQASRWATHHCELA